MLRAISGLTITATGAVLSQGSGGGQFGGPSFSGNYGGGGGGGGILLDCCIDIVIAGTIDNRGRDGDTLSVGNGGTVKLFYQGEANITGSVQTGRLFDAGADSSGQNCNAPPSIPAIISPLDTDVPLKTPSGDMFITFLWTPCTDPEGSSVTYEVEIARDGAFKSIEKSVTNIGDAESVQVLTVISLPVVKFWRVRSRDSEGQESDWSKSSKIRLVLDDGIDHGGGDCSMSAGFSAGHWVPTSFGVALLAFGLCAFGRRSVGGK